MILEKSRTTVGQVGQNDKVGQSRTKSDNEGRTKSDNVGQSRTSRTESDKVGQRSDKVGQVGQWTDGQRSDNAGKLGEIGDKAATVRHKPENLCILSTSKIVTSTFLTESQSMECKCR
jgi:hypothetical protein